jgi:hypothetical protein
MQFIDHDITLVDTGNEAFNIPVPKVPSSTRCLKLKAMGPGSLCATWTQCT